MAKFIFLCTQTSILFSLQLGYQIITSIIHKSSQSTSLKLRPASIEQNSLNLTSFHEPMSVKLKSWLLRSLIFKHCGVKSFTQSVHSQSIMCVTLKAIMVNDKRCLTVMIMNYWQCTNYVNRDTTTNFVASTLLIECMFGVRHMLVSDTDTTMTHVITLHYVNFANYYRWLHGSTCVI